MSALCSTSQRTMHLFTRVLATFLALGNTKQSKSHAARHRIFTPLPCSRAALPALGTTRTLDFKDFVAAAPKITLRGLNDFVALNDTHRERTQFRVAQGAHNNDMERELLVARGKVAEETEKHPWVKKLCWFHDFFYFLNKKFFVCEKVLQCYWETREFIRDGCHDRWLLELRQERTQAGDLAVARGRVRSEQNMATRPSYYGYRSRPQAPCAYADQMWLLDWIQVEHLGCDDLREVRFVLFVVFWVILRVW